MAIGYTSKLSQTSSKGAEQNSRHALSACAVLGETCGLMSTQVREARGVLESSQVSCSRSEAFSVLCAPPAASGNADQPFSLNLNRATANVTGGSTAAAPSVNSAVEQILNPKVTYNSGGRRLA